MLSQKYKSAKHSRKSYTTNNQSGTVAILGNTIRLPKIGVVKAVIHRVPDPDWRLKSATISQDSDGKYYASVLFAYEPTYAESATHIKDTENALGLDYSSKSLYVDSNGNPGSRQGIIGKAKSVWQKSNAGYPVRLVREKVKPNHLII